MDVKQHMHTPNMDVKDISDWRNNYCAHFTVKREMESWLDLGTEEQLFGPCLRANAVYCGGFRDKRLPTDSWIWCSDLTLPWRQAGILLPEHRNQQTGG